MNDLTMAALIDLDAYQAQQKHRIRVGNQLAQLQRDADNEAEPHGMLEHIHQQQKALEKSISTSIEICAIAHPMWWFFDQTKGIGPGLAMQILALLDIHKAPTAGHFWSFAGLNPDRKWGKGEKRPHCAALKRAMWLCAQQWIKLKNDPTADYARWLFERRDIEWRKNLDGKNAEYCEKALAGKNYRADTDAKAWLSGQCCPIKAEAMLAESKTPSASACKSDEGVPMIPPAQVLARACRWTEKLFLAHLHDRWFRFEFGEAPPKPYVIEHAGHAHVIQPPQAMPVS